MKKESNRVEFTKAMKKTHKILIPNMADIHFHILEKVFLSYGYNMELLTNTDSGVIQEGLKYVHNDTCYPALLTIGQLISALKSGKYDVDHTAVMMSQSGGGCRASNYIHLLRKALKNAGLGQVPAISLNISGLEKNGGFSLTLPMILKAVAAMTYGDLLMLLSNQTRPYEVNKGETDALVNKWVDDISEQFVHNKGLFRKGVKKNLADILDSFEKISVEKTEKVKVGIVGEIYVKYAALANNNLEKFLASQDCEVMVPGIIQFFLFKIDNRIEDINLYGGNPIKKFFCKLLFRYVENFETDMMDTLKGTNNFTVPSPYAHLKTLVKPALGYGCKMGEGWLLTAEMMELIESGYGNIVCAQPFGCLPNHIVGKGMIRKLQELYPQSNVVAIDYDAGATKVNQENRIKLMIAVGKENLQKK